MPRVEQKAEPEEDLKVDIEEQFAQTASDPGEYRARRPTGRRLQQDPYGVVVSGRYDVFNFELHERNQKILNLASADQLAPSAVKKPRGARIGNEGDIFTGTELTAERNRIEAERKEKEEKKKAGRNKREATIGDLRAELKEEKKKRKASEKGLKNEKKKHAKTKEKVKTLRAEVRELKAARAVLVQHHEEEDADEEGEEVEDNH